MVCALATAAMLLSTSDAFRIPSTIFAPDGKAANPTASSCRLQPPSPQIYEFQNSKIKNND